MDNFSENLNSENEVDQLVPERRFDRDDVVSEAQEIIDKAAQQEEQKDQMVIKQQLQSAVKNAAKEKAKQVAKEAAKKAVKKGAKQAWMAFVRSPYFWPVVGVVAAIIGIILLIFLIMGLISAVENDPCIFGGVFSEFVGETCDAIIQ